MLAVAHNGTYGRHGRPYRMPDMGGCIGACGLVAVSGIDRESGSSPIVYLVLGRRVSS
jgi:hypothetical protein